MSPSPDPFHVVREALLEPVPCPTCGRTRPCRCLPRQDVKVDTMATRIVEHLTGAGLLHEHAPRPTEITEADAEQTARWLAEQSRHPRYGGEGWRMLLISDADVHVAHGAAIRANQPAVGGVVADLHAAKTVLLSWHKRRADEK